MKTSWQLRAGVRVAAAEAATRTSGLPLTRPQVARTHTHTHTHTGRDDAAVLRVSVSHKTRMSTGYVTQREMVRTNCDIRDSLL
jgi:hypothetical protein